ncbi:hypothetical protein [Thermoleptolyngbya sp.]|jgi:hypothetical protein
MPVWGMCASGCESFGSDRAARTVGIRWRWAGIEQRAIARFSLQAPSAQFSQGFPKWLPKHFPSQISGVIHL